MNNLLTSVSEEKLQTYTFMKVATLEEIQAFVGLLLYRGIYSLNNFTTQKLFLDIYRPPIFSATMRRDRFLFLLRCLSFDDETTRAQRWKRFAVAKELFELFSKQCMPSMKTTKFLSLDKILYPMRNQVSFKQYNLNNPAKCGMLFKSLNSLSVYICDITILRQTLRWWW